MAQLPAFFRLKQKFEAPRVADIPGEVQRQLASLDLGRTIKPGDSVAITAGSRGIANIATITKAIVDHVKSLSANPFVVPAMGSHGGGTPEGQLEVLDSYGITEEFLGCPIRSSRRPKASTCISTSMLSKPTTSWSAIASSRTPTSSAISKAA